MTRNTSITNRLLRVGARLVAVTVIAGAFSAVGLSPATACASSGSPTVTTDKQDYGAGETVGISGTGYACGQTLTVTVTGPDGTSSAQAVNADAADGTFATTYQLGYEDVAGRFDVAVSDAAGTVLATAVFYDSHFRFGHLTYTQTGPASVNFTLRNAFRRDAYDCRNAPSTTLKACTGPGGDPGPGDYILETVGGTTLFFGDGTSTATLIYQVDAIDVAGNWLLATALQPGTTNRFIPKTYATTPSAVVARINDCCRTGGERNNPNDQYQVQTLVNLTGGNTDSPTSSLPAIVDCPRNATCSFSVPATDASGNALSFRLSTAAEAGDSSFNQPGPPEAPNAASVHATTGVYSWNTTGAGIAGSLYSTQVTIEERTSAGALVSKSAIDFLIRLVDGVPPVFDVPPTPASGSIIAATAGSLLTVPVQASDADAGQSVFVSHLGLPAGAALACGATPTNPRSCTLSWTPTAAQGGDHIVSFTAQDSTGLNALPHSITIRVSTNVAPVVNAGDPVSGDEGLPIALSGTATDADGDPLALAWTAAPGSGVDAGASCTFSNAAALATAITCTDDGTFVATLTADDGVNPPVSDTVDVTVGNVAPAIAITGPAEGSLFAVGTPVTFAADVSDAGANDALTCSIDLDLGTGSTALSGTVTGGAGTCGTSHSYAAAGVYTVTMSVADDDGGTAADTVMIVVYDPSAGFVTGGGWISSPAGAYAADPTLTGKANFGFVSRYKKGATTPSGNTEFQFHAGGFRFHSDSYDWLVVSGAKAQYKGTGSVNGVSGYGFLVTVTDGALSGGGGVDKFRIKVWELASGTIVYDNAAGASDDIDAANPQAISGGSIVIHKK